MWFSSCLRNRTVSPKRRPANRFRPALEALEDRRLLSFGPVVNYPVGTTPLAVLAADFNNDTVLDLAAVDYYSSNTVSVLLGNGDGTFQSALTSATGARPVSIAAGDFNADGNLDLATANDTTLGVSVLLGNGNGTFQPPTNINIGSEPWSLAVADFNADGRLDLGVTSNHKVIDGKDFAGPLYHYEGRANVLLGNGNGTFATPNTTLLGRGFATGAASADVNGDGRADFVTTHTPYEYELGTVQVLLGNGSGKLLAPTDYSAGYNPYAVAARDVNGDGKIDLVTAGYNVSVLLADGVGGFQSAQVYTGGASFIDLGDFNGDGVLDIATASNATPLSVRYGIGDGFFSSAVTFAVGSGLTGLAAGDFNGDGWLDAAATNQSGFLSVLINDRAWPPTPLPSVSIGDVFYVWEGNTGSVNATFTVSLSGAYDLPVTVHFATADDNAIAGSDYTATSGDVTFARGQITATITVPVLGDQLAEPNEYFFVNLSAPTNATIADGQGYGRIRDDEPQITIYGVTKKEGSGNAPTLFVFTVRLLIPYDQPVTVRYTTSDGSATVADNDYVATSGALTFAPGEQTKTITVVVKADKKKEANETFFVLLSEPSANASLYYPNGLGAITNDDR